MGGPPVVSCGTVVACREVRPNRRTTILARIDPFPDPFKTVLSRREVEALCRDNGFRLPEVYIDFLVETNGGRPTPDHTRFTASDGKAECWEVASLSSLESAVEERGDLIENCEMAADYLPIASLGDDLLLMRVGGEHFGTIEYWMRTHGHFPSARVVTAFADFPTFLNSFGTRPVYEDDE